MATKTATKPVSKPKATEVEEKKELSLEEMRELREEQKAMCSAEINEILQKYQCDLTARVIVSEQGNIPQVFIIDARG
jgi:hypothetical protein